MVRMFLAVLGALILLSGPVSAAKMTEKQKCLQAVIDVGELMKSDDTPEPSENTRSEVESLLEVSAHLCQQGNFHYAETVLTIARSMVVSE